MKGISEQTVIYMLSGMHTISSNHCVKNYHTTNVSKINSESLKKFHFLNICLNFILIFFTITRKVKAIVITCVSFAIIYLTEYFVTLFTVLNHF